MEEMSQCPEASTVGVGIRSAGRLAKASVLACYY